MTPNFEDLNEGLYQEVMTEAAENFFGRRRNVEDAKEIIEDQAAKLRSTARKVVERADLLWALLLDGEAAEDFFEKLEVCLFLLPQMVDPQRARLEFEPPWALTAKGKYVKLLQKAYAFTWEGCNAYLHGRVITDSKGRKRRTVNYLQLMKMTDAVNRMVGKENACNKPSCVLQFSKSMNTTQAQAEEAMGGTGGGWDCELDDSMSLGFINRKNLGIVAMPNLPPPDAARSAIVSFGKQLYSAHGDRLEAIIERVRTISPEVVENRPGPFDGLFGDAAPPSR